MPSKDSDCYINWKNKLLDNRYVALKKIDYGKYATVWTVYDLIDKQYYAIKIAHRVYFYI